MRRPAFLSSLLILALIAAGSAFYQFGLPSTAEDAAPEPSSATPSDRALEEDIDLLSFPYDAPLDSLSEQELMLRLSRLHQYQADLLLAQSEGDEARAGRLLGRAVRELGRLMEHPGTAQEPRLQRTYQQIIGEYEAHFGAPDTLQMPRGAIFSVRAEMFAEMDRAEAPLIEEAMYEELQPKNATIGMPVNGLVRAGLQYLERTPDNHVYRWLQRKETYFPMIEHILAEEGVPDELKYLAIVESGLNPTAVSPAGAAGLWQFMPQTARAYGLEITPWVDERLDPEKATRAAARHLRDLHDLFGDWHLALAGYNFSPGRLRQALRRAGRGAGYWDVINDIPRETRNYVPTFIATALVISNPGAFDFQYVTPGPRYRYDYVPVDGMLPIETVAELADTTEEQIRALNPELKRSTLPPSADPYYVRLPLDSYADFRRAYEALPDEEKRLTLTHEVRSGESIGGIASRYRVPVSAIQEVNSLSGTTIRAGQRLVIPMTNQTGSVAAVSGVESGEPVSVRYGARAARPIAPDGTLLAMQDASPASGGLTTHVVRPGDTLYGLARKYGVEIADIRRWNNLSSNMLRPGQELKIQGG